MSATSPEPSELWLVRHGPTEWSENGRHTSITDLPLLPEGEEPARAIGERLAGERFDRVLTSPLTRARHTAELAGYADAEVDEDLFEWRYGEYEGLTTEQVREQEPGWELWTHGAPGGESAEQVGARLDAVIDRARAAGGRTLVFAHSHSLSVLAARWVGLGPAQGRIFRIDPATLSILGWKRDRPILVRLNT